mmetsp:Transcript_23119/g.76704  ORF Transcript_23119/g.76704 Transcript_23119/m.76704 type:complete len:85 (+) Transcript_23119:768-1022(+)
MHRQVAGLVTMDGGARSASVARKAYTDAAFTPGRTFARIVEELTQCGYAVAGRSAPRCSSAASVPQRRPYLPSSRVASPAGLAC